jgi:IS30 family transposase
MQEIEERLTEYAMVSAGRDNLVLAARKARLSVRRIADLMGIGHATVERIIARERREASQRAAAEAR